MNVVHIYTAYQPKDPETIRRNQLAESTWKAQPWKEVPVEDRNLPRLWREENRAFPYIKDIFDLGITGLADDDIGIYTNADILVTTNCTAAVIACLSQSDACYAYRRDFKRLDAALPDAEVSKGHDYAGSDLCGFRAGWWRKHRAVFPDMILGHEAWDPCYRIMVDQTNPGKAVSVRDVIYHERHDSYWEREKNRYRLAGQIRCLTLAARFMRSRGVDPKSHYLPPNL